MSVNLKEQAARQTAIDSSYDDLRHSIEQAAHFLPAQGPIEVFVHHNTLHAFEHMPFDEGVRAGGAMYGCHPYLTESRYRREFESGRIRQCDLETVLQEDLGDGAGQSIAGIDSRYELQIAMLLHKLPAGNSAELQWVMADSDALRQFSNDAKLSTRSWLISETFARLSKQQLETGHVPSSEIPGAEWAELNAGAPNDLRTSRERESIVLTYLWRVCCDGVRQARRPHSRSSVQTQRHRDLLREATGKDSDTLVNEVLGRLCSAFLDQGFAATKLPMREVSLYRSFLSLYGEKHVAPTRWLRSLRKESLRLTKAAHRPLASIEESLRLLGVAHSEQRQFITQSMLALRGWAGMVWQMESNADWMPTPAPEGSLVEFLAVRLVLDRLALSYVAQITLEFDGPLSALRSTCCGQVDEHETRGNVSDSNAAESFPLPAAIAHAARLTDVSKPNSTDAGDPNVASNGEGCDQLAFHMFKLAQIRGWLPTDLRRLSREQWKELTDEVLLFDDLQRRRIFHSAYERNYHHDALDSVLAHVHSLQTTPQSQNAKDQSQVAESKLAEADIATQIPPPSKLVKDVDANATFAATKRTVAAFQLACCIDDREESFRRHLEECDPECETFGIAGFFGVAMYYRGLTDAHYRPLCPVSINPQHYIDEAPLYSALQADLRRTQVRRRFGQITHQTHLSTRTLLGGMLTGLLGSVAAFPLVARVLFPRIAAKIRSLFGSIVHTTGTEVRLERQPSDRNSIVQSDSSTSDKTTDSLFGYSVEEMADIVEGSLQALGLSDGQLLARLFVVCGHGSSSANNPHAAAYDCGACGGGRGGPNARVFAQMANDLRVRSMLANRNLVISNDTVFVGCYHNTCDDSLVWYDLDHLPLNHRPLFERAKQKMAEARTRSAHERCRRFESAKLTLAADEALAHVEGRAEDLSQTRSECGHATNALCFVGRREWSRGLFLDRRAFLTSYDPTLDDERSSILEGMLCAVIPVCAGINLEYYFSHVDPTGYGCGTKLPHNVTSLLGVMDGAFSDLRTGLPWQMVELHEPVRLLFVIETTPDAMQRIIDENPAIRQLVNGEWVQLAVFDSVRNQIYRYVKGVFTLYEPEASQLPTVQSSIDWYGGKRNHLGFASIKPDAPASSPTMSSPTAPNPTAPNPTAPCMEVPR